MTIDRIEKGKSCRLETKRKIILALGTAAGGPGKDFTEIKHNPGHFIYRFKD